MDEEKQKAIDDFIARNPTLDQLVSKLLTSKEADVLFKKIGNRKNEITKHKAFNRQPLSGTRISDGERDLDS